MARLRSQDQRLPLSRLSCFIMITAFGNVTSKTCRRAASTAISTKKLIYTGILFHVFQTYLSNRINTFVRGLDSVSLCKCSALPLKNKKICSLGLNAPSSASTKRRKSGQSWSIRTQMTRFLRRNTYFELVNKFNLRLLPILSYLSNT